MSYEFYRESAHCTPLLGRLLYLVFTIDVLCLGTLLKSPRHAIIKSRGKQVACLSENSCKVVLLSFWKINKLSLKGLTFIFSKFDMMLSLLLVSLAIFCR